MENTQEKKIVGSTVLAACLGWGTGLLLIIAAVGKILGASEFSVPTLWGFFEPIIAVAAILHHRRTYTRALLSLMFLAFILYLLLFVDKGLDCKCFGYLRSFQADHVLFLDLMLFGAWGWLAISDVAKPRLKLLIVSSVFVGLCFLASPTLLQLRTIQLTGDRVMNILTTEQRKTFETFDAAFFLRSRCGTCVAKLPFFRRFCIERGIKGVIVLGNDAANVSLPHESLVPHMRL